MAPPQRTSGPAFDPTVSVLVGGDTSGWQPPGERFEGGTFTLDTPTSGTFSGDAAGTKVATFRLLPAGEEPACRPAAR